MLLFLSPVEALDYILHQVVFIISGYFNIPIMGSHPVSGNILSPPPSRIFLVLVLDAGGR